jgi:flagellar biosynthetic protein FliQ
MEIGLAIDLVQKTLLAALALAAPILGAVLLLALFLAILTTVFNLQEQTLTTVPKIAAAFVLTLVLAPWMLRSVLDFTVPLLRDVLANAGN